MMKIDILTLFPKMFDGFLSESIIKRAIDKDLIKINIYNIRDYSPFKNRQVDDYPFGGGSGMVLMCEPVVKTIENVKTDNSIVIMLTPAAPIFDENKAIELSKYKHLILLCGHYEGFDERISNFVDMKLSIGDFVLTGGEIPAMAISDAVIRLIPGVINESSLVSESFNNNLLDYPNYTKPVDFRGYKVPDVLLSGHHKNINDYRYQEQLRITKEYRSDLLEKSDNHE